jgi:hypothetical protein
MRAPASYKHEDVRSFHKKMMTIPFIRVGRTYHAPDCLNAVRPSFRDAVRWRHRGRSAVTVLPR